jgi:hypothetical protein
MPLSVRDHWRRDRRTGGHRSGTRQPLYAVACLSALQCEAVGAAGTIRSTADGGITWRAQASPLQGSRKILYRIACVPPGSCYVIARPDTILVTHDGGATWSGHVLPPGGGANLTDQTCLAGNEPALRARPALCRLGLLDIACVSQAGPAAYATTLPAQPRRPATRSETTEQSPAQPTGPPSWPTAARPLATCTASAAPIRPCATRWETTAPSSPAGDAATKDQPQKPGQGS